MFTAGGDVNDFNGTAAEDLYDLMRYKSHRWFSQVWNLPQPLIVAVNGTAAGGGANLALAGDVVIGSPEARFGETFVRIGIVPDLGGLFLLPRIVGLQRAKQLCFSGKVIDIVKRIFLENSFDLTEIFHISTDVIVPFGIVLVRSQDLMSTGL